MDDKFKLQCCENSGRCRTYQKYLPCAPAERTCPRSGADKSVLAGKCKAHLLAGQSRGNLRAGSADFPKDTCIFYGIGGLDCPPNQVMAQVVHNAGDCKPVCQQRRSGINELLVIKTNPRQSQAWLRPTVFVEVEVGCLLRHEIRRC